LIDSIVKTLLADTQIKVNLQLPAYLPPHWDRQGTLGDILTRLITNALQAMNGNGELLIRPQLCTNPAEKDIPLKAGRYICVHIIDNGRGIAPENLPASLSVFHYRSDGAGMGLPIVYSLLKKNGGYIRIHSQEGKGTDCEVYLPIAEAGVDSPLANEPAPFPPNPMS